MSPLEIRVLPVGQLVPAAYNPRKALKPDSPAYRKLRASLQEFGLVEPLVWNELTGRVVGGHARLRILRDLGVEEVPVSVVRLSDAREAAFRGRMLIPPGLPGDAGGLERAPRPSAPSALRPSGFRGCP